MDSLISITTQTPELYSFLKYDLPNGMAIVSSPPISKRGLDVNISFNIDIAINLKTIAGAVVAAWIVPKLRQFKCGHKTKVNGKQISVDNPNAEELIAKEIEQK